jgi:hypothetical protein
MGHIKEMPALRVEQIPDLLEQAKRLAEHDELITKEYLEEIHVLVEQ